MTHDGGSRPGSTNLGAAFAVRTPVTPSFL